MSALSRLTLLAALACCASAAHAVGLGPIELRSYLNEPLRADVALRDVVPERLDSISVRVASESAYEELGLARNDYLRTVDASLLLVDGQPVVRLRGNRPLQEPLLELLLVVREGRQLVQRSYTLFIDPPQFAQQRPPVAPEPEPAQPQAADTPAPAADRAPAAPPADDTPTESAATAAPETEAPSTTASNTQPTAARPATQPAVEAPADQAPSEPAQAEQRQPEAPTTADAAPPAADTAADTDTDTATVVAQPAAPAAEEQAPQPEESPRFFTTESERQLDPELLAEIGRGSGAARDSASAPPRPTASRSSGNGFYPVRRGETLWRVAANTRPQGPAITMQQMMLAIVQTNPNAFENGDASELLAGARLRIPDAARITSVSPAEAERQMRALLEGERTTQQAAASEPAPATQTAADAAEEAAPAEPAAEAADDGDAARELAALAETDPASGQDDTSTPAAPADGATPADTGDEGAVMPEDEMAQAPEASDKAAPAAEATAGEATEGDVAADAAPSAMEQADTGSGTTATGGEPMDSEDAAQAEAEAPGPGDESASAAGQGGTPSEASAPTTDADQGAGSGESTAAASGTAGLLGLPWYLLLVVAGVVLLGIAGIIEMRRRAAQRAAYSAAEEEPRFANLTGASAGATAAATGAAVADDAEQDEDSDALSQASEADPAPATQAGELGESASDDPLADADFRIAYGMYDDAAERLTDAISRDPENATLRLKLAEVYCAADDKERFLDAADTAARTGLSEAEEAELADMAARIAPDSRFATAIGASMTAGTVFAESHAASASDSDVVEESSGETAADDDFASLLESSPDSTEPEPTAADLNEENRSGGPPLGAAPADGGKSAEAEDDLAFGDDFAAELADPSEAGRTGEDATAPGAEPGAEDNILDFDLDSLEFGDETPAPTEASAPAADDEHALDFDLEGLELPETPSASPEPAPVADDNSLDFDWETSEPDASVAETEPTAVDGDDKNGQPPASDLPTQGIGSTDSADPARPEEPATSDPFAAAELDAGDFDLDDFSLEDFDVDSNSEIADSTMPAGTSEDPPTLELPEPEPSAADSSGDDAFALDDFEIDAGDDTSAISGGDEGVAGQLDLARAYVDMGEGDMARPLLEEVLQSGDTAQRQEAQRLLDIAG